MILAAFPEGLHARGVAKLGRQALENVVLRDFIALRMDLSVITVRQWITDQDVKRFTL